MSTSATPLLTSCGCCGDTGSPAQSVTNPPGLSALAYRAGTHGSFVAAMLDTIAGTPGLSGLTVRDTDDPAIALMDAWAVVLDVLTFYQERIANEGYLRTATERVSVLQLASEIAYQLNSGVAAQTQLAFLMDSMTGSPNEVFLNIGTKVQSVPAQNQTAQVFETVEPLDARLDWNLFGAKKTLAPFSLTVGQSVIYLGGIANNLQKGDTLLIVGDERRSDPTSAVWVLARVASLALDTVRSVTAITLDQPLAAAPTNPAIYALRQRAAFFGANAPDWRLLPLAVQLPYMGLTAAATNNFTTVPTGTTIPPDWPGLTLDALTDGPVPGAAGAGVTVEYFANLDWTSPTGSTTLPQLYLSVLESIFAGTSTPAFSVRLSGWLLSGAAGQYTLTVSFGPELSGSLYLDGAALFMPNMTATVTLQANHYHRVQFDVVYRPFATIEDRKQSSIPVGQPGGPPDGFGNYGTYAVASVSWTLPDLTQQLIPTSNLFPVDIYTVHLDAAYPKIVAAGTLDNWVALSSSGSSEVYQVTEAVDSSQHNFTLNAKTTRLRLSGTGLLDIFADQVRDTLVLAQSEQLYFAEAPDNSAVAGASITTDQLDIDQLPTGRTLLVTGQSSVDGTLLAEVVELDYTGLDPDGNVILYLQSAMVNSYVRSTVQVYANVAEATNGETKTEILGSGDGSVANQSFTLRQNPLTYTQAATASGAASTLQVRVNDLLWTEIPSFYGAGPSDRVYTSRIADDGTVSVNFGDGVAGSRLPTGTANVVATYRVGTGLAGMLAPNQLTMLLSRPLGLKSVNNPLAPTGAADPESRDDARINAPLTVLTLDRIVSLDDYENFARAFSGIGKARADWFWEGEHTLVYVTVAPSSGVTAAAGADPFANLRAAIDAARDPAATVRVGAYTPVTFGIAARVLVDKPTYVAADVLAAVTTALTGAFSFASRDFAQPVFLSEVSAVVQAVPGVIATQVIALHTPGGDVSPEAIASSTAYAERQPDGTYIEHPAELLTLDPNSLKITEMTQI